MGGQTSSLPNPYFMFFVSSCPQTRTHILCVQVGKFSEMVGSLGQTTLTKIAKAGPESKVRSVHQFVQEQFINVETKNNVWCCLLLVQGLLLVQVSQAAVCQLIEYS